MSTLEQQPTQTDFLPGPGPQTQSDLPEVVTDFIRPLASLKLSVALFAMGIFLVLAGTLAQVEKDMHEVISGYFRCWFAWIDFQVFFPKTWVPHLQNIPGGFWFPGGWLIGLMMTANLLSAHSLRFKVQAKGQRLVWGLLVTLVGIVLTWAVIEFGTARDVVYETADFDASGYWTFLSYVLLLPAIGCGVAASKHASEKSRKAEFITYSVLCLLLLGLSLFLIVGGEEVRIGNSSMRILWQLIQATFAGGVLLGGCLLLFRKRAGIVLLHAGVLLLMANELVVHTLHEEANMILAEGETSNFAQDIRSTELAVIDRSNPEFDRQTVIADTLLKSPGAMPIQHPDLPFKFQVLQFFPNADLIPRKEEDENPATFGLGLSHTIEPTRKSAGTNSSADFPAAYVAVLDAGTGEQLQVLLVSALASSIERTDKLPHDDREYEIALRFKRNYKSYSIHLIDVRKDDYIGTSTPKNYSSEIRLVDESRNEDRTTTIWMNNPLRFAGETFYQSGYQVVGDKEVTTLQIVTNEGWMIPYVACMIVAIGMLYQFGLTLLRFLNRYVSGRLPEDVRAAPSGEQKSWASSPLGGIPALVLTAVFAVWLIQLAEVPKPESGKMDFYAFGQLPVAYGGRIKPFDTLARNSLRILSNRETVLLEKEYDATKDDAQGENEKPEAAQKEKAKAEAEQAESDKTISATQWLLELISGSSAALERPVIRIDNEELRSTLKLERRKSHRYTLNEIQPELKTLIKSIAEARELEKKQPEALSVYQRKALELERKLGLIDKLSLSFMSPPIDPAAGRMDEQIKFALSAVRRLDDRDPPLMIPPVKDGSEKLEAQLQRGQWETYSKAFLLDLIYPMAFRTEANPFSQKLSEILFAFEDNKPAEFNQLVRSYQQLLQQKKIADADQDLLAFESRFNSFAPLFWPAFIYIAAFVLAVISWMAPQSAALQTLNRASFWLVLLTFLVHTGALLSRIYISGRPPVTNLYSSAVFIGWAVVFFGLVLELVYKRGIGNVLAASAGFGSLWIAHGLAGDGDTFIVLQAVLDTQFWLSTHVVCITLGYAATFVAGFLGVIYVCKRNPFSWLAVIGAILVVVSLRSYTEIPTAVRYIGPFLLAIPLSLIPMYVWRGNAQLALPAAQEKALERMIYGTLCFALWFSFVGTVLGGLWADDSWGRFWGWDPKENGALIIVLWNALVLHARWDRIVGGRGLALLAIAGNITTIWSWFGVNELGIGLHAYGFTEGTLFNLMLAVLANLTLITIGVWGSSKSANPPAERIV